MALPMTEHKFIDYLRDQAKSRPDLRFKKNHGSGYSIGFPDNWLICRGGNFLIEFKAIAVPVKAGVPVDPFKHVTEIQWRTIEAVYNINGCAAIGVAWQLGSFRYLKLLAPVREDTPWYPHTNLDRNIFVKIGAGGSAWPWDTMIERLILIRKERVEQIKKARLNKPSGE